MGAPLLEHAAVRDRSAGAQLSRILSMHILPTTRPRRRRLRERLPVVFIFAGLAVAAGAVYTIS